MPEKNLIHVWKETLSSRPLSRETYKGMHLAVLHQAAQQKLDERLFCIQFEIQYFVLCELLWKSQPLLILYEPLHCGTTAR